MSNPDIHIVLDTSAILAFCSGSVSVGEILTEVQSMGGHVGIPVLCWAAADYVIGAGEMIVLRMLIDHPTIEILWPSGKDFDPDALAYTAGGSLLNGTVAHFATRHDADVLTGQRDRYADLLPADQVISIDGVADE